MGSMTRSRPGYAEVLRLLNQIRSPYLGPFRVKVIGGHDPMTLAAIDIHKRFPGTKAIRLREGDFGGTFVDEVYIYPSTRPVTIP